MAIGPGEYDDLCTMVREQTNAAGVIVAVINGKRGSGLSVQADLATTLALPELLDHLAAQIRADNIAKAGTPQS
jgi:hypothetical protein